MTEAWPDIPFEPWKDTCATLHLWTQIVGKYRLARTPWMNHSWHATLYVTARGLTTSPIPAGSRSVQFDFDFVDHKLIGSASDGSTKSFALEPMTVAEFHRRFLALTDDLGVRTKFHGMPNEVSDPIPFAQRHNACILRCRCGEPVLARTRPGRSRAQRIPHGVPRQGQSRPSLLGQLRSGRDALFGSHSTPASRRHPRPARCHNARSLFARSEFGGILARRRPGRLPGVLFVRLSGAAGLLGAAGYAGCGFLS